MLSLEEVLKDAIRTHQRTVSVRLTVSPDKHPVMHLHLTPDHPSVDWMVVGDYVMLRQTFPPILGTV